MIAKQFPGLVFDQLPSGKTRCRVRVKGVASKKIVIPFDPEDERFFDAYQAARRGVATYYRPTPLDVLRRSAGFEGTIVRMIRRAKQRAAKKGWDFSITAQDVRDLVVVQGGRCAVSGMKFDINPRPRSGAKRPFGISIDRLDNRRGYSRDNIRLTTVIVNTAILNWTETEFRTMCAAVARQPRCPTDISVGHNDGTCTLQVIEKAA